MSIITIIQMRYFFTLLFGLSFFIGVQVVPSGESKEYWNFFEALLGSSSLVFTELYLFREATYQSLIDEGININYKFYQSIGLLFAIVSFIIITLAIKTSILA